jgi:pimeloyl-ACP methyl ester carboxylesterase
MESSCVVIGIHGLANKPPKEELSKWWHQAIVEGLERNEGRRGGEISFELVYWADWRYPEPIPTSENEEPYLRGPGGETPLPRYEDAFWDSLRAEASDLVDTPVDWFKRAFGVGELIDEALSAKLGDLGLYYENAEKRDLLRNRLRQAVLNNHNKRIMLIAHSMGSIVAYDVLRLLGREAPGLAIDHLITIGSPLGLPHVKYHIWKENDQVRTPSIVRRWTNLSDRRDIVAADTHLARDFQANDRGVRLKDDLVLNTYENAQGKTNHHKSYGYLRTPELSSLIRSFI